MSKFFLIAFIILFSGQSYCQQTFGDYTITPVDGGKQVHILYRAIRRGPSSDSTVIEKKASNVFEQFFGASSNNAGTNRPPAKYYPAVKSDLITVVSKNPDLKMLPKYPDYILEILALIKGKNKKEKVKQIYSKDNQSVFVTEEMSTNMTMISGSWEKTISFGYTFSVSVKTATILEIPSFTVRYDDEDMVTPVMKINLK